MMMLRRIIGVNLIDKVKSVDIRKELGVNSIHEKVREIRLHMQRMEENNKVKAVVDMIVPGKRPRVRPRGGLCPKGYAGTADHPGGCPGQNSLDIKKSGR